MGSIKFQCEKCGAPALVSITNDEAQGVTVRHLCLECADREETSSHRGYRNLNYGAVLIAVGAFLIFISVMADWMQFGADLEGFGWKQWAAVGVSGMLVAIAAIVQVPTLLVIGLLIGVLTAMADFLEFGASPGFGLHQVEGTIMGVLLVAVGWWLSMRKS